MTYQKISIIDKFTDIEKIEDFRGETIEDALEEAKQKYPPLYFTVSPVTPATAGVQHFSYDELTKLSDVILSSQKRVGELYKDIYGDARRVIDAQVKDLGKLNSKICMYLKSYEETKEQEALALIKKSAEVNAECEMQLAEVEEAMKERREMLAELYQ